MERNAQLKKQMEEIIERLKSRIPARVGKKPFPVLKEILDLGLGETPRGVARYNTILLKLVTEYGPVEVKANFALDRDGINDMSVRITSIEFNRLTYMPATDSYIKTIPYVSDEFAIGKLITIIVNCDFLPVPIRTDAQCPELKGVPKERAFKLKMGDCMDINELIELVLDSEGNLKQNYQKLVEKRIWSSPGQLKEIIKKSGRDTSKLAKIQLFIPDVPITDEEHRKQLRLLESLTLILEHDPVPNVDLSKVERIPDEKILAIFKKNGHDLLDESREWIKPQNRGERFGSPKNRWDYLNHLLKNGFRAMGIYGPEYKFTEKQIEEHIGCLHYIIGQDNKGDIDRIAESLLDCYSGTYDRLLEIFAKRIFSGGTILGKFLHRVEETKHNLVYAQFIDDIAFHAPDELGFDETHVKSGRIDAIEEIFPEAPQIVNIHNVDPLKNRIDDRAFRLRIKTDFLAAWPRYLKENVVDHFVEAFSGFKLSSPDYKYFLTEIVRTMAKGDDRDRFIDDESYEIQIDFKTGTFILLAMLIHHMMGFGDIVMEQSVELAQRDGVPDQPVDAKAEEARIEEKRQMDKKERQQFQDTQRKDRLRSENLWADQLSQLHDVQKAARAQAAERQSARDEETVRELKSLGLEVINGAKKYVNRRRIVAIFTKHKTASASRKALLDRVTAELFQDGRRRESAIASLKLLGLAVLDDLRNDANRRRVIGIMTHHNIPKDIRHALVKEAKDQLAA